MSLSVGIIGLTNAGKSTLFNALAARRLAETAPRPFTTIEPHEAVVAVPDENLEKLALLIHPEKVMPATVTFIDIAGLVKGAHQGEGLGNQFLAKIQEVDAIVHVVRAFADPSVSHPHASHDPGSEAQILEDIEIVNLELQLAAITSKPSIYVLNVGEKDVAKNALSDEIKRAIRDNKQGMHVHNDLVMSVKLEEDLIDFSKEERDQYLRESGIVESGLARLIRAAYGLLDLITFYTIKGGKEVHGWSIKKGGTAIDAAGKVHSDFAQNFIKAETIGVDKLLVAGSWKSAKEKGVVRLEGRDYIVQDRDVIEFKVGSG